MENERFLDALASGRSVTGTGDVALEGRGWTPHPKFAGVRVKTLVGGADTGGAYSCHLVRVEPGHGLDNHVHPAQNELHEVLAGDGVMILAGRESAYAPGTLGVIPPGAPHAVRAGRDGIAILATFVPAAG